MSDIAEEKNSDFALYVKTAAILLVIAAMSVYYYGLRALIVIVFTTAVCCGADAVCVLFQGKKLHIHDISPFVTGLTLSMMLPASVPYTVAAAAGIFAICIAKHPLSGTGRSIFNPAAVGWIFVSLFFTEDVLKYPRTFTDLDLTNIVTQTLYSPVSPSSGVTDYELMVGAFAGPMGTTAVVLLAVTAVIMAFAGVISKLSFTFACLPVIVYSMVAGGFNGVKYAVCGDMFLFGLVFLICTDSVRIGTNTGRILHGFIGGLFTVAASALSAAEYPIVYAAVISAPFVPLCDDWGSRISKRLFRKKGDSVVGKE
ncbi:MAG: RnfABCDGE type electron transport complex subunit D [Oscillospiraceae bacterium]|nr:RnfABCDGE type electron transport complex subunit D [Oscillospiraceae bacterium]